MRNRLTVAASAIQLSACAPAVIQQVAPTSDVAADVHFLASPSLEGRGVGTAGGDAASRFLAEAYVELGIPGAFPLACGSPLPCGSGYFQVFEVEGRGARNVLAAVPGADPAHRGRYVVLGAHFDHLGRSSQRARDSGSRIRPGADDNASGTAAVLELARRLAIHPPTISVLFAHFDAEELGLAGSRQFVENYSIPHDSIALMVNLDMVGRLRGEELGIELAPAAGPFRSTFDSLAVERGISLRRTARIAGRSDHTPFAERGIPAVALFTGFHQDYHRSSDTADKIDFEGIERVVGLVEALVRSVATRVDQ